MRDGEWDYCSEDYRHTRYGEVFPSPDHKLSLSMLINSISNTLLTHKVRRGFLSLDHKWDNIAIADAGLLHIQHLTWYGWSPYMHACPMGPGEFVCVFLGVVKVNVYLMTSLPHPMTQRGVSFEILGVSKQNNPVTSHLCGRMLKAWRASLLVPFH